MTKISTDLPAFRVWPAQPEEAGAFFAQTPEQNAQMGAIGCVRMDFGKRGTAFSVTFFFTSVFIVASPLHSTHLHFHGWA